ncbi:MAG: hypothetical protein QOI20_2983 [Acidimicrobiaceae bacterium]|nr:hypothetical protein [Acidimicrobiaceae bacterium]
MGDDLDLLVLAAGRGACIGVDMASGAFVLARWPGRGAPTLRPFDMASARLAAAGAGAGGVAGGSPVGGSVRGSAAGPGDGPTGDPLARPEAACVERPPHAVGRLRPRVAERYVRPLLLPAGEHLLGFAGSTTPYWALTGHRPSICLVAPHGPVSVVRTGVGVACRFTWRGVAHELPLADAALSLKPAMDHTHRPVLSGAPLADLVGFVPRRLLVALSPPRDGLCHKVIPGLLP